MRADFLLRPGTKFGPCDAACKHIDCAVVRAVAVLVCEHCGEPIGYDTAYYRQPDGEAAHAQCVDASLREVGVCDDCDAPAPAELCETHEALATIPSPPMAVTHGKAVR